MKIENIWDNIFNYSDYVKGGEYSASDIIGDVLAVKLRKIYPKQDDMKVEDKISAWIGSSIHTRAEQWLEAENAFSTTNMQSEVKLSFKNISGTADLIINNHIILDYKTGKESSIKAKLRELTKDNTRSSWREQISIYTYLNHKQNQKPYGEYGYIAWLVVENHKHGVEKVKLLPKSETIKLIKDFLVAIEQPIEEMNQCDLCVQFKHRWCGVRTKCPKWTEAKGNTFSEIEEW